MLLKDYLISRGIPFKEDREGFIHVLNNKDLCVRELICSNVLDYTLLKSVEGDLQCQYANEISLPNLVYVGGYATCRYVDEINLPNLKYVGYRLDCECVSIINLPNLKYVGGGFQCDEAYKITSNSLKYVGGSFTFGLSKISFPGLVFVKGCFGVAPDIYDNNYTIIAINLPNLKYIKKWCLVYDETKVQGANLPNLKHIMEGNYL